MKNMDKVVVFLKLVEIYFEKPEQCLSCGGAKPKYNLGYEPAILQCLAGAGVSTDILSDG